MRLTDAEKLMVLIPYEEFNARMAIANASIVKGRRDEMRLVDADALISFMRKGWRVFPFSELQHTCDMSDINNAPTVDAVEVVRCKDCKHGQYDFMTHLYWCRGKVHPSDWFCADGERRSDDDLS